MIIVVHKNNKVLEVIDKTTDVVINVSERNPLKALINIAVTKPEAILIWCHFELSQSLNYDYINAHFSSKNVMLSFSSSNYFPQQIGYVEDTPFINLNKKVKYPTWLMSSNCGAIHSSVLLQFRDKIEAKQSLSYNLNSIAKLGMKQSLLCYSDPHILLSQTKNEPREESSKLELFRFVKQHYKTRWIFLLFLNLIVFESRFNLLQVLSVLFTKRKKFETSLGLEQSDLSTLKNGSSVSVLIPTLGRPSYLYDVLQDLENQTLLPNEIIIIEQNDTKNQQTELDYLQSKAWSFKIKHRLINQTGVCNARNIGLQLVSSEYIFFADDDIRFGENILKDSLSFMTTQNLGAIVLSCLRKGEKEKIKAPTQWASFGSGCSFVKSELVKNLKFDLVYEHGFGEDTDFGMQLRNMGIDILYVPFLRLLHLKAPIGGFRKEIVMPWLRDSLTPKPSPTVMLYRLKHTTNAQLKSYKLTLFLKFFKDQKIKNPFRYYRNFKKRWNLSIVWASRLIKTSK